MKRSHTVMLSMMPAYIASLLIKNKIIAAPTDLEGSNKILDMIEADFLAWLDINQDLVAICEKEYAEAKASVQYEQNCIVPKTLN